MFGESRFLSWAMRPIPWCAVGEVFRSSVMSTEAMFLIGTRLQLGLSPHVVVGTPLLFLEHSCALEIAAIGDIIFISRQVSGSSKDDIACVAAPQVHIRKRHRLRYATRPNRGHAL